MSYPAYKIAFFVFENFRDFDGRGFHDRGSRGFLVAVAAAVAVAVFVAVIYGNRDPGSGLRSLEHIFKL